MKLASCPMMFLSISMRIMAAPAEPIGAVTVEERRSKRSVKAATFLVPKADHVNTTFGNVTTTAIGQHHTNDELLELITRSADLFWGPVYIGNLKLTLTNPHVGYAGPKFPDANHVNFHVDKKAPKNKWTAVVNAHIVKYKSGGSGECLYVWDSVSSKTIFDSCFDNFVTATEKAVEVIKNFVDKLLKNANFIASFVIIVALGVALVAVLSSLAAVAVA